MPDPQDIYIDNFADAAKETEKYVRSGIFCAALLLLLSLISPKLLEENKLFSFGEIKLPCGWAAIVLYLGYFTFGIFAILGVRRCRKIISQITNADNVKALMTQFTLYTSPKFLRISVSLIAPVLVIAAFAVELSRSAVSFTSYTPLGILMLISPYLILAVLVFHPLNKFKRRN